LAQLESLAAVQSLADLPAVAPLLGFEPTWQPIDLIAGGAKGSEATPIVMLGRSRGLVLFGLMAVDAGAAARRIAANLARRGGLGLVLALDPGAGRLGVAATAADCPAATLPLGDLGSFERRLLQRGRAADDRSPLDRCLGWAEALSGRTLDDRFFRQFRATLEILIEALPNRAPRRDRHALALLDLTRILFLYFVQERGWLDGRPRFLREELDRVLGRGGRAERRFLIPLFFGTLNRPIHRRNRSARRFGRIPFLNGGLFEVHPLEHRWPDPLPDEAWRDAFDQLFERYHFTIGDPAAAVSGIGPDMLGRVFEGVMDPEDRRETGAFYTPAPLVTELVEAATTAWLAAAMPCSHQEASRLWREPDDRAQGLIRGVTVLDPAVGTGAFLVGALDRLVAARVAGGEPRGRATREVVATNLFGVDRNPNAVHLAELRLWLEVIRADGETDPERVDPLPNLDALIRQGDSIFERIDLPFGLGPAEAGLLHQKRRAVIFATGAEKRACLGALRQAELRAARLGLESAIRGAEQRIREIVAAGRAPSLFGDRQPLDRSGRRALVAARQDRARLRAVHRRLATAGELPWFHYGSQFADVVSRGGFDLTLGNPPWVRAEALTPSQREALKRRYRWFRPRPPGGSRPGFTPMPDLSLAFVERGLQLTRPGGVVGLLLPAKLLTAQYAAAAREQLAAKTTLRIVAPLTDRDHGFDALVYPLALVAERSDPAPDHVAATRLDGTGAVRQRSLGAEPWAAVAPTGTVAPGLTDARPGARVGTRFRARLGVKTGADRVFLDPDNSVEASLIRPAIRGRDVTAFRVRPVRRLLWAHDHRGVPLDRLPPSAARILAPVVTRLRNRADYRTGPSWSLFRIDGGVAKNRVVWPDLARSLTAAALVSPAEDRMVPLNTCYWIGAGDRDTAFALAAWLNSSPIRDRAKARATVAASGYSRFNAATVESLPLPPEALTDPALIRLGETAHRGAIDQSAIDARVGELLAADPDDQPRSAAGD
jgi:hypothetical protein